MANIVIISTAIQFGQGCRNYFFFFSFFYCIESVLYCNSKFMFKSFFLTENLCVVSCFVRNLFLNNLYLDNSK